MNHATPSLALALVLAACAAPTAAPSPAPVVRAEPAAPTAPTATARHFGGPIATGLPAATLGAIVAMPAQFQGQPVRVEGTVVAVCQAAGCWMEMRDAQTQAHIRMHGHSFFVPRDITGRHAAVEATVVSAHPATECDQEAQQATGRLAQVELDATGIEID